MNRSVRNAEHTRPLGMTRPSYTIALPSTRNPDTHGITMKRSGSELHADHVTLTDAGWFPQQESEMTAATLTPYAIPARRANTRILADATADLDHMVMLHDFHVEQRPEHADRHAKAQEAYLREAVEALRNVLKDAAFKEAHAHLCDALEAVDAEIERRNPVAKVTATINPTFNNAE